MFASEELGIIKLKRSALYRVTPFDDGNIALSSRLSHKIRLKRRRKEYQK